MSKDPLDQNLEWLAALLNWISDPTAELYDVVQDKANEIALRKKGSGFLGVDKHDFVPYTTELLDSYTLKNAGNLGIFIKNLYEGCGDTYFYRKLKNAIVDKTIAYMHSFQDKQRFQVKVGVKGKEDFAIIATNERLDINLNKQEDGTWKLLIVGESGKQEVPFDWESQTKFIVNIERLTQAEVKPFAYEEDNGIPVESSN